MYLPIIFAIIIIIHNKDLTMTNHKRTLSGKKCLAYLKQVERGKVIQALGTESIQTIAVILANCGHLLSTQILADLPTVIQQQVNSAMISSKNISDEIISEMAEAFKQKLNTPSKSKPMVKAQPIKNNDSSKNIAYGSPETAAAILMYASPETKQLLSEEDNALYTELNNLLFRFEDLEDSLPDTIRKIFTTIEPETISLALKISSQNLREKILTNLSPRKASIVNIELMSKKKIIIKDIEDSQKKIMDNAFQLQSQGLIVLNPESETI